MNLKRKSYHIKNYFFIFLSVLISHASVFAQENFNYDISGTIPGGDKILLAADKYGARILDSVESSNGKFAFKGKAAFATLGTLIVESKKKTFGDYYNLFIEPGKIKVRLDETGRRAIVRGSKNNDIASEVEAGNKDFWLKVPPFYDSINLASMKLSQFHQADVVNNDSIKYYQDVQKRMEKASAPYIESRNKKLIAAFKKYPQTLFTAYYAFNSGAISEDTLKAMYAKFDDKIKNSEIGKEWNQQLFQAQHLEAGTAAPGFTTKDMLGKTLNLSDYKGKYVLLDFWATWCMPCRAGNPHLIELYKKYKDQGVEFIGISDDDKNVAGWKKAVKNDGIDLWPQVLRGRGNTNSDGTSADLSKMYMVDSYPTKILIDKEGKIVANWVGDDELEKTLSEIFSATK